MRSAQEYRQIKVHHIEFGEDLVVTENDFARSATNYKPGNGNKFMR